MRFPEVERKITILLRTNIQEALVLLEARSGPEMNRSPSSVVLVGTYLVVPTARDRLTSSVVKISP